MTRGHAYQELREIEKILGAMLESYDDANDEEYQAIQQARLAVLDAIALTT